ncbi:uncharacterized protein LOC113957456 [Corapipo altera]|uniref:uncharacterized protein LOC113957456 n=1 Tax=Corapipo altera TaxID=415028 RepID=UPI000FD658C8|nr:uncharacterized protein LOC113957456 [Corapipo altera]
MDSATVLLLAVLAILPKRTQDPQSDAVAVQGMKKRQIFLEDQMTELWEEVEWRRALDDVPLLWVLQHWLFWLAAAAVLGWLAWQREEASRRRREREELSAAAAAGGPFAALSLSPLQDLPFMGRTLKKLVRDLLEACQVLSQNTFMPELHPATGQQGTIESWHELGDCTVYQLVLFLRPPPLALFPAAAARRHGRATLHPCAAGVLVFQDGGEHLLLCPPHVQPSALAPRAHPLHRLPPGGAESCRLAAQTGGISLGAFASVARLAAPAAALLPLLQAPADRPRPGAALRCAALGTAAGPPRHLPGPGIGSPSFPGGCFGPGLRGDLGAQLVGTAQQTLVLTGLKSSSPGSVYSNSPRALVCFKPSCK